MKMATKCLQTVPFAHAIQLWQLVASDAKEAQLASRVLASGVWSPPLVPPPPNSPRLSLIRRAAARESESLPLAAVLL